MSSNASPEMFTTREEVLARISEVTLDTLYGCGADPDSGAVSRIREDYGTSAKWALIHFAVRGVKMTLRLSVSSRAHDPGADVRAYVQSGDYWGKKIGGRRMDDIYRVRLSRPGFDIDFKGGAVTAAYCFVRKDTRFDDRVGWLDEDRNQWDEHLREFWPTLFVFDQKGDIK